MERKTLQLVLMFQFKRRRLKRLTGIYLSSMFLYTGTDAHHPVGPG